MYSDKNVPYCYTVRQKPHINRSGIEPEPARRVAGD